MLSLPILLSFATSLAAAAGLTDSSLVKHVNTLDLDFTFNAVKASYWTGLPHHRRTPFALSPDGTRAFLAYLDESDTDVHVQRVDPDTFAAVGTAVTVSGGKEAGGLVAHNDGFALLTNEALPSGTTDAPADNTPVPVLYRYTDGAETWKTFLGGPGVHTADGLAASPDMNGDLVYSEKTGLYGAYFVITDYTTDYSGHFGDSVQYVSTNGTLEVLSVSSSWGCSHNTGIAFEAADEVPYASICAEDSGDIWLNTDTRTMTNDGVKISNENTTNGATGEPMGGMSGSYSNLARYQGENTYIFSWVSRGAVDLYEDTWLGDGYVSSYNRTNGRNVAIATFSDKSTMNGEQASSVVGAASGDSQVNWITNSTTADCSNAHVATFDNINALVTWEQIDAPQCDYIAMGCAGEFSGSYFQVVNDGAKVGEPIKSTDTYVAGDMVTMTGGRICWPYVSLTWTLDAPLNENKTTTQMSFACISYGENSTTSTTTAASSSAVVASTAAVSSVASSSVVVNAAVVSTSSSAVSVAAVSSAASSAVSVAASTSSAVSVAASASSASSAVSVAAVSSAASSAVSVVASASSAVSVAAVSSASSSAVSVAVSATTLSTAVRGSAHGSHTHRISHKAAVTALADAAETRDCQVDYVYV